MILSYSVAKECENWEALYICYKCGKCGRVFKNGIMIDNGGTTIDDGSQEEETGGGNAKI